MGRYIIKNTKIVNEGKSFFGDVLIEGAFIKTISGPETIYHKRIPVIDGKGKILVPGVIDDQVHFREPGLIYKGEIESESRAAIAGGVTSYMEMPNTNPQTVTLEALSDKFEIASKKSAANYSFYLGATNDNINEITKADPKTTCGLKIFMGSSTGNMLVDKRESLERIFAESPLLIATHCEDETTIRRNMLDYKTIFGDNIPIRHHPYIRSEMACFLSSSQAVKLADKYGSRLHILHLSTAKEMDLFDPGPVSSKKITSEVCVHHLWFDENDYSSKDTFIKWNPSIKKESDKLALFRALLEDKIDVVATDHAPHTIEEKTNPYFSCPSGGPMVQHSLTVMLEFWKKGMISIEKVVEKMCHAPSELFRIDRRGFIREGYYADLVLVDPDCLWEIRKSNLLYKCGWSPLENEIMSTKVDSTFVNGELVYSNGIILDGIHSMPLRFNP
jgi:dihydroorotase